MSRYANILTKLFSGDRGGDKESHVVRGQREVFIWLQNIFPQPLKCSFRIQIYFVGPASVHFGLKFFY